MPPAAAFAPEPALQLRVVSETVRIDHDQLAIEDGRSRIDPDGESGELGKRRGEVTTVAVEEPDVAAPPGLGRSDEDEGPQSAPRRLEQVPRGVERFGQGSRQHRPERGRKVRQRRDVRFEPQRQLVAHRGRDGSR